jgi:hypothetical protein
MQMSERPTRNMPVYERPTLSWSGTFGESTGRFFQGFFADGQGGWNWSG